MTKKELIIILVCFVAVLLFIPINGESSYFKVIYGMISDTESAAIRIDPSTHSMQTIAYEHHEIHAGSSYTIWATDADLDIGDTLKIVFTTPNTTKWLHMLSVARNSSASTFQIQEAPTVGAAKGTESLVMNRNRNVADTSAVISVAASPLINKVSVGSALTAAGTIIDQETIGVGKDKGTSASRGLDEFILKQSTTYAISIIGLADNGNASLKLDWYEHTDKD